MYDASQLPLLMFILKEIGGYQETKQAQRKNSGITSPAAPAKDRCIIQPEWREVSIRNCPKPLTTYTS
jgi:hypothetical protein